jgi:hypothetical protein
MAFCWVQSVAGTVRSRRVGERHVRIFLTPLFAGKGGLVALLMIKPLTGGLLSHMTDLAGFQQL